jgi:carbonic anhydrase
MTNIDHLLDRNRVFAGTDARRDVPTLPFLARQGLYIVICIDCRVDPAQILGIELGDALVQRNIGGRVTPAVIADIAYAAYLVQTKAPQGPWFEVAVIHHTDCGSALLADDDLRHGYAQRIGVDERALGRHAGPGPGAHRPYRRAPGLVGAADPAARPGLRPCLRRRDRPGHHRRRRQSPPAAGLTSASPA